MQKKIHPSKRGVHVIAIFEAVKGILGLTAAFGLFYLQHKDLQAIAEHLLEVLHFDPTSLYAQKFIETAGNLNAANLRFVIFIAILYTTIRFVEAYGLWRLRAWAEWFAIISGSVYIPIEVYELFHKPTFIRAGILIINILIVVYLYSFRKEQVHEKKIHESEIQAALSENQAK